jgi:DEAD/DEAH box helicase domain-containing protein
MHFEVIFDLETKKLFRDIKGDNPADLGVSVVSLYSRKIDDNFNETEGTLQSFWEADFEKMWPLFQKADRIIGFNSIGFDVPALSPYANFPFGKLPHFDIIQKVKEAFGKRISLDAIAKETLDREKTDTGLNAVYYWEKGDKQSLKKLQKYCEEDVLITKDIYDYGSKQGELLFKDKWNTLRKLKVDFAYPKQKEGKQVGLFS